ncbi:MAG: GIY-YIG nuclease family protein [Candidatus Cloacimonetes bacterium]|nr:GIY-YIG nuclease family protein [Candidatus Cloacimonadota bacterium]MCF7866938.1 GIY-YIG nuclease family protein [Candidatus Woesearchaeota archaeon]
MKSYKVYIIRNVVNNKVYIGKTSKSIEIRFKEHLKNANTKINRYFYDAINKYGIDNFTIELIIEVNSNEEANLNEKYWINKYKSKEKEFGYNMTLGGDGGNTGNYYYGKSPYDWWVEKYGINKAEYIKEETYKKVSNKLKEYLIGMKTLEDRYGNKACEIRQKISYTLREKINSGDIVINTSGLKSHKIGEFKHSEESKTKMSYAKKGKTYEDIFDARTTNHLKEMHRANWTGVNNPNYVENITDDELFNVLNQLINNDTMITISKNIGKSHYKIKQRLIIEGIGDIQKLKREDKENKVLIKLLRKYEK